MKDINKILSEMLKESGATILISSPEDIRQLQQKGLKLDKQTQLTTQEYIDKLFETKKKIAHESIEIIPSLPDVPMPVIILLYKEITECVLFGLNGAAISLCAVLVEFALKQAIIKAKHNNNYDDKEWDHIERKELGKVIKEAKQLGILDDTTKKQFDEFKDTIRNPYLHYNIKRITKGVRAPKVKKLNLNTLEHEDVCLKAEKDPILWPYAKKFIDKKRLKSVLDFTCYAINLLLLKQRM